MAHTVLVVEDDENIREVVTEYLQDSAFIVLHADNGREALSLIAAHDDIDLIILDIMLPEVSGLDILKVIRTERQTPVIMLTAMDDEYTQIISFDGKADDYVTKPFSPKLLVKRAEALLRRSGKTGDILQIGPVTIDVDSYEAYENGRHIQLTLRELELLKTLMQHQGKVLSRQQLLNLVWGYDYFGDERIVDVHIKNVRKKFQDNIIATVKGVGYKIEKKGSDTFV